MQAPTWDLETIFEGGPAGLAFRASLDDAAERTELLVDRADSLPPLPEGLADWVSLIGELHEVGQTVRQLSLFTSALSSAHTDDRSVDHARARVLSVLNRVERAWLPVEHAVGRAEGAAWEALAGAPELAPDQPRFAHLRAHRHLRLPLPEATLANELAEDGIHAWGRRYDHLSGELRATLPSGRSLGISRAFNLLAHADETVRAEALTALDAAWGEAAPECARVLSHIVGTRRRLNARRGGLDPVADSLERNRMDRESLEAMLEAARRARPLLVRYLGLKARALGKEALSYADLSAPVGQTAPVAWAHARDLVERHFGAYHPQLGAFAQRAFLERWIEAEDRDHKRPGAWCGRLAQPRGASRVFMTFGGTFRSTTTLAHELGHAFHNHVLREVHPARQRVPSTLAETASIFAESLLRDAALEAADTPAARLAMLDARLTAGASFLMNLPFRYELERELYGLRAKGMLDPEVLTGRCVALQERWYGGALSAYFPHFWASKLHFYISHFAFYNYPYTFGYLFATLVYRRFRPLGPPGYERYCALLRETGHARAEPLAAEALGLDLHDPEAWWEGIAPLEADLAAYEAALGEADRT